MAGNRVRGGLFTVMVVRIGDPADSGLGREIAEQVERSPGFFANGPVVLDLKDCPGCTKAEEFLALKAVLRRNGLSPVGIQNASALQQLAARDCDLATFPGGGSATVATPGRKQAPAPQNGATRLVTQPVRSGSQIYAQGGDLIVVSSVSAGAEVIADGHIHIYGTLRGRAFAGAAGDKNARIFVQRLEAELVYIAGHYMVAEEITPQHLSHAVQIALVGDDLRIQPGIGGDSGGEKPVKRRFSWAR